MNDSPLLASIVIVNYNGGETVLDCLESVFAQLGPRQEVIVVDNASVDGSPDIIKARFSEVEFIQSSTNLGFGAASNLGAARARGQYLVFLNPDTVATAGWLDALIGELQRTRVPGNPASQSSKPEVPHQTVLRGQITGLVTSRILMADDPARINTCGNSIHLTGITLCQGLGSPRDAFNVSKDVAAVSGAAFAMPLSLFHELGGFDQDMFLYMEDTDLSLRARLAGYQCRYVAESAVLHRYVLKLTPMKVFYQERNRYTMLLKNLRWPTLVALLPAFVCAEIIAWAFVALKDRSNAGNKIRAYRWIWQNWGSILSKRAIVQSLRRVPDRVIVRSMSIRLDFGQATSPALAFLAHLVFDAPFAIFKLLALAILWW